MLIWYLNCGLGCYESGDMIVQAPDGVRKGKRKKRNIFGTLHSFYLENRQLNCLHLKRFLRSVSGSLHNCKMECMNSLSAPCLRTPGVLTLQNCCEHCTLGLGACSPGTWGWGSSSIYCLPLKTQLNGLVFKSVF